MALPRSVTIGPGWSIGPGWTMGVGNYAGQTTPTSVQNVAGSDITTGFFYVGGAGWSTISGTPNLSNVAAGWLVVQLPGATVVSVDSGAQTITITGGTFISGSFYTFTGV